MNRLNSYREVPFVKLTIPFLIGIIAGISMRFFSLYLFIVPVFLLVAFFFVLRYTRDIYKKDMFSGWLLHAGLLFFGYMYTSYRIDTIVKASLPIGEYTLIAKVIAPPVRKEKSVKISFRLLEYRDSTYWVSQRACILAYYKCDSTSMGFMPGDIVMVKGTIDSVQEPKNPGEFNYKKFLFNNGINRICYIKEGCCKKIAVRRGILSFSGKLRQNMLENFKSTGINNSSYALISALVIGYRDEISAGTNEAFARAGIMHILSVSGMHVGILYYIMNLLLRFFIRKKCGKYLNFILVLIFLWMYAFLSGLSPSVLRACFMFSVFQAGTLMKRSSNMLNTIAFTAFVLFLFDPLFIASVSFQLSFLAVISIVVFQPFLYKALVFKNFLADKIWMLFTLSVAAQLGTTPITLFYFHQFPVYFWLSNIIIIPMVTLLMYLSLVLMLVSILNIPVMLFARATDILVKIISCTTDSVNSLPFSQIAGINHTASVTILLYCILCVSILFYFYRKPAIIAGVLVFVAVIQIIDLRSYIRQNNLSSLVVFNFPGRTAFSLSDADRSLFFLNGTEENKYSVKYYTSGYFIENGTLNQLKTFDLDTIKNFVENKKYSLDILNFKDKRIAVADSGYNYPELKNLTVDYLIVRNNGLACLSFIDHHPEIRIIIIDSSNKYTTFKFWVRECAVRNIPLHIVKKNNAFVCNF